MERDFDREVERYDRMRLITKIDRLAGWLDTRYRIPGTNIRFGGDALIGLIPGIGDTASLLLSAYILNQARNLNLPLPLKLRMTANVFLDWLVGLIPFAGDLLDIGYRANLKNINLIREYLQNESPGPDVIEIHPRKVS